ncbi:MAG: SPASM domain-containing protein [Nitrospinae bacterium]|nr:SPASM domain-containing protein [Nitrospinota bacterium]
MLVALTNKTSIFLRKIRGKINERKGEKVANNPFSIFNVELTNKCPMSCIMCPRTNNMTRNEGFMNFELFKKVVDEFTEKNPKACDGEFWLHHFGESLMHPGFPIFIEYAIKKGLKASISINPIMLKKEIATNLLKANPSMIYLSLDGHDDGSFERIRGLKNSYRKSKEYLLNFLEIKKSLGVKTKVLLSMIDFDQNKESIQQTKKYWEKIDGIDEFLIKEFVKWDGKAADVNQLVNDSKRVRNKSKKVVCKFPWKSMTVTWDGNVVPCCYDYNNRYILGNVEKQTLSEIWNGEKMQLLREEFIHNDVTNTLCSDCEMLYSNKSFSIL